MSYILKKQYTVTFEIVRVVRNFMNFRVFSRTRKDITNCELCEKTYTDEDNLNLAFVKGKLNQVICDSCAVEAIKGGAEEGNFR